MNTIIVIITLAFYPDGVTVKTTEEIYLPANRNCYLEIVELEEKYKQIKDRELVSISCSKKGDM